MFAGNCHCCLDRYLGVSWYLRCWLKLLIYFPGTGLQYFILFMMFYKKTYKKKEDQAKDYKKTDEPSSDLLEDLGETVERVRRDSLKVVGQVRRNSITALGKIRRNSVGKLPPILSNNHLKELEKLQINGKFNKTE